MADVEAVSGAPTVLDVEMRNVGAAPLALVFAPGCSFRVLVYDGEGNVANREGDSALGGLCGTGSAIAITLPPNGVLTKRVPWTTRKNRLVCENQVCHTEPGSPIGPGTYRVELGTPFSDPVDGNEHHRRARRVSATLTVTAPPLATRAAP